MSQPRSYKDLEVWKRSLDLAESVYRLSAKFPPDERYGLTSQIRRAAISVPSNIAEGAGRNGTAEFIAFLGIASGSLEEVDTQLLLSGRLGFGAKEEIRPIRKKTAEIGRMLVGLRKSLRNRNRGKPEH